VVDACDLYAENFDPLFTRDELESDCKLPAQLTLGRENRSALMVATRRPSTQPLTLSQKDYQHI